MCIFYGMIEWKCNGNNDKLYYSREQTKLVSVLLMIQYNRNGRGWTARRTPGIGSSLLNRRSFNDEADITDSTKHSAGNDIDADNDSDPLMPGCWFPRNYYFVISIWIKLNSISIFAVSIWQWLVVIANTFNELENCKNVTKQKSNQFNSASKLLLIITSQSSVSFRISFEVEMKKKTK